MNKDKRSMEKMQMKFKNYTPHAVVLNDGRTFPSEGVVRVSQTFSEFSDDVCAQSWGEVQGLPEPEEGTLIIVSALVLGASNRYDLVAPATGHPECKRDDKGFIVSVPGFVRNK